MLMNTKNIFFPTSHCMYANVSIDLYLCSNEAHEITCKTVVEHMGKANCLIVGKNTLIFYWIHVEWEHYFYLFKNSAILKLIK